MPIKGAYCNYIHTHMGGHSVIHCTRYCVHYGVFYVGVVSHAARMYILESLSCMFKVALYVCNIINEVV